VKSPEGSEKYSSLTVTSTPATVTTSIDDNQVNPLPNPPHEIISSEEVQTIPEEQYSSYDEWDSELWSSRIVHEIRTAKKERHEELLLIKRK